MSATGNVNVIPVCLKAKTVTKLIESMHRNNRLRSIQFKYNIMHDGTQYIAWYYIDIIEELRRTSNLGPSLTK